MLTRLNLTGIQQKRLSRELPRPIQPEENVESIVASIIDDVKENGDKALKAYAEKFDGGAPASFLVPEEEIEEAVRNCSKDLVAALKHAAMRIRAFHESQIRDKKDFELVQNSLGFIWTSGTYKSGNMFLFEIQHYTKL